MLTKTDQKVKSLEEYDPQLIRALVVEKGVDSLTPKQKTALYTKCCNAIGIPVEFKPFDYISFDGKTIMYINSKGANILASIHNVTITVTEKSIENDCYIVWAKAIKKDRTFDDCGVSCLQGLKGKDKANAMMKASTKAHRRALLGLIGIPFLAQEEIEPAIAPPKTVKPFSPSVIEHEPDQSELEEEWNDNFLADQQGKKSFDMRLPL